MLSHKKGYTPHQCHRHQFIDEPDINPKKNALKPRTLVRGAGYTLIEVILSLAIIGLIGTVMVGTIGNLLHSQRASKHHNQAVWLAQDALEITYNLFQTDFNNFPETWDACHPMLSSNNWALADGAETDLMTHFTRKIEIKPLYRTLGGDLEETGTTPELAARHIKVTVSWQENGPKEIALEADFVNWDEVQP